MNHEENTFSAQGPINSPPPPEKIEINGVTYVRKADWVDENVNRIKAIQEVAGRTGVTLRQAYWFVSHGDVLPD